MQKKPLTIFLATHVVSVAGCCVKIASIGSIPGIKSRRDDMIIESKMHTPGIKSRRDDMIIENGESITR